MEESKKRQPVKDYGAIRNHLGERQWLTGSDDGGGTIDEERKAVRDGAVSCWATGQNS
jgi:hypothetical protein